MWISWIISFVILSVSTILIGTGDYVFTLSGDSQTATMVLLAIFWVIVIVWFVKNVADSLLRDEKNATKEMKQPENDDTYFIATLDDGFKKKSTSIIRKLIHMKISDHHNGVRHNKNYFKVYVYISERLIKIMHTKSDKKLLLKVHEDATEKYVDAIIKEYIETIIYDEW